MAEPDITELTTIELAGTGAFDKLMQTVKLHLTEEYDNNRIVGKEYAEVYLGAMSAVMQHAISYLHVQKQVKQTEAQTALTEQQTVTELSRTSDSIPADLGYNSTTSVDGSVALEKLILATQDDKLIQDITDSHTTMLVGNILTGKQTDKLTADILDQDRKLDSDIAVNDQQILKLVADITDQDRKLTSDIAVNVQQISKMATDSTDQHTKMLEDNLLTAKQVTKLTADITDQDRKIDSELLTDTAQRNKLLTDSSDQAAKVVAEVDLAEGQTAKLLTDATDQARKLDSDITVNVQQIDKMEGEVLLLGQRTISELAQTSATVHTNTDIVGNTNPWLNASSTVGGTSKEQQDLYNAQTEGFARDAEQKLAKIMVDTWSIRMSQDEGTAVEPANLHDQSINDVLYMAKANINAPNTPAP
jgi:hypothetical protein